MWVIYAALGAIFTSLTTIFTKIGIKNVKSHFATFYRTGIVILCCVVLCFITNSYSAIRDFTWQNYLFLFLSGIMTGISWLSYNKALKEGPVHKVAAIDKSSFVLSSILFLCFFFNDTTKNGSIVTILMLFLSMILMLGGTLIMVLQNKDEDSHKNKKWIFYASISAISAAFVALFVKMGLKGIPSSSGTLIRTILVFVLAGLITFTKKDKQNVREIDIKSWVFLTLSGIATGAAWILEYEALNTLQSNPVVVSSIGKVSIIITMIFSWIFLKEKFTKKDWIGLVFLSGGIALIMIFGL